MQIGGRSIDLMNGRIFWEVAKASNQQDFNYYKAKLAQETPEGAKDIMRTEPVH
jgi:hypothetical protein